MQILGISDQLPRRRTGYHFNEAQHYVTLLHQQSRKPSRRRPCHDGCGNGSSGDKINAATEWGGRGRTKTSEQKRKHWRTALDAKRRKTVAVNVRRWQRNAFFYLGEWRSGESGRRGIDGVTEICFRA